MSEITAKEFIEQYGTDFYHEGTRQDIQVIAVQNRELIVAHLGDDGDRGERVKPWVAEQNVKGGNWKPVEADP